MDDKTKSIVAHLTIIGWVIALIMNQTDKGPNTSFYLRQMLGFTLLAIVGHLVLSIFRIPMITTIWSVLMLILWVLSLIGAFSGEQKPLPIIGEPSQQVFKGIS